MINAFHFSSTLYVSFLLEEEINSLETEIKFLLFLSFSYEKKSVRKKSNLKKNIFASCHSLPIPLEADSFSFSFFISVDIHLEYSFFK